MTDSDEMKQEVAPKMWVEWLHERKIVIYTMGSNDPEAANILAETCKRIMDEWPQDQPYLAAYQIPDEKIMLTTHIRKHLADLNSHRPDLEGRSAAILPMGAAGHAVRVFLMITGRKGTRRKRPFTDRETAVKWLEVAVKD